ncbi:hypothetical protein B0H34DRAFT_215989 [Crassisporium funariophilum]|nr:hypothetical protein B0H34DRAFT_215989 [Crassisporium funariophilum]
MQCTWPKIARLAARSWPAPRTNYSWKGLSTAAHAVSSPSPLPLPLLHEREPQIQAQPNLTPAQLSRAAAHAVHLSLANRNISDAFLIVNSIRYASLSPLSPLPTANPLPPPKLPGIRSLARFKSVAIAFPPSVSPRLPSHALLHGLIRLGLTQKASTLAEQMMGAGIPVRCKTLECLFQSVAEGSRHALGLGLAGRLQPPRVPIPTGVEALLAKGDVLTFRPSVASDKGTKFALRLLTLARQSRQRRSHNMFRTLMALCLINGEIIAASLLFGLMLRDWQARVEREPSPNTGVVDATATAVPVRYIPGETPFPVHHRLRELCVSISQTISPPPSTSTSSSSPLAVRAALQALANLAGALDAQQLPYENVTPLVSAMYRYKRPRHLREADGDVDVVWVRDAEGVGRRVRAGVYFGEVLDRLILDLPSHPPLPHPPSASTQSKHGKKPPGPKPKLLPPLDLPSYNTLLHYALLHRHNHPSHSSLKLADKVIRHMTTERHERLEPSVATYNIVARAGTVLRDGRLVRVGLGGLKVGSSSGSSSSGGGGETGMEVVAEPGTALAGNLEVAQEALTRFEQFGVQSPPHEQQPRGPSSLLSLLNHPAHPQHLEADNYTLATRISHLTATGHPHLVVAATTALLPGLTKLLYPSLPSSSSSSPSSPSSSSSSSLSAEEHERELTALHAQYRAAGLRKAVDLGPVVFTAILNACKKAGRTGVAEKVWGWAREAEGLSWVLAMQDLQGAEGREGREGREGEKGRDGREKGRERVEPWCLPVAAYTIMIDVEVRVRLGDTPRARGGCSRLGRRARIRKWWDGVKALRTRSRRGAGR